MVFAVGELVQHRFSKESLFILRVSNKRVLCRTMDLREIWFYKYELEDVDTTERLKSSSRFID